MGVDSDGVGFIEKGIVEIEKKGECREKGSTLPSLAS
jgi:hypothetical protein